MPYTQATRQLGIETPLGDDVFLLNSLNGVEGISQLFSFQIEMISEQDTVDFDSLVGKESTLRIELASGDYRYWNGIFSRFGQSGRDQNFVSYRAELVPWLWLLTRTSDCRIFQHKKVPDIITQIFQELGQKDYELRLFQSYQARDYCVQYRETDFVFISRLMEDEGIFYFFEHENGKHKLILGDAPQAHKPCPNQSSARYELTAGGFQDDDVVTEWNYEKEMRPGQYALNDYNFEMPSTSLLVNVAGEQPLGMYDYPGRHRVRGEGETLARRRLQEEQTPHEVAWGRSNCRAFSCGRRFTLEEHYRDDQNRDYVLTTVRHEARQGGDPRSGDSDEYHYANQFGCIPYSVTFRPPRITPLALMPGSQTAMVVGPAGEEIYTDQYGRVKVQFHWDREGKRNENSSCWMRVSYPWAGKGWGAISIPRVGQEVIVDFLEGDPDQPIVTGRVFNAEQMPPYPLPDGKMQSGIRSRSTKGGAQNFNEFSMDDTKGSEIMVLHAERDLQHSVENDAREVVGKNRHLTVTADQKEMVKGSKHATIQGERREKVTGNLSVNVGGARHEKVGSIHAFEAGNEIHLKGGQKVVIEAGNDLTIKVGNNFVRIVPDGVIIRGKVVNINSGGSPGEGTPASPQDPAAPEAAGVSGRDFSPGAPTASVARTGVPLTAVKFASASTNGTAAQSELDAKKQRLAQRQSLIAQGRAAEPLLHGNDLSAIQSATDRLDLNNKAVERARLAQSVYDDSGAPVGWTRLSDNPASLPPGLRGRSWSDPQSGFQAALYKSQIDSSVVLAFRGTTNQQGWENNFEQGAGYDATQYREALRLAQAAQAVYGDKLEYAGHSLGGGLSAASAVVTGSSADTFNSAGLHPNTVAAYSKGLADASHLIDNFSVAGEVLTGAQGPVGNAIVHSVPVVGPFLPPVYPAVGRQHSVPAVDAAGNAVSLMQANPVDRHGMNYVVNGLEKQKSDDTQTIHNLLVQ